MALVLMELVFFFLLSITQMVEAIEIKNPIAKYIIIMVSNIFQHLHNRECESRETMKYQYPSKSLGVVPKASQIRRNSGVLGRSGSLSPKPNHFVIADLENPVL